MNTNPNTKRILCYGDSLTHGSSPGNGDRYPADKRWTGILQDLLGNDYDVIEEGLGGRTTEVDDPKSPGKNGFTYFLSCISSHIPLDVVIIMLGTNDLKDRMFRPVSEIASSFKKYNQAIIDACNDRDLSTPRTILIAPPLVNQRFVPKEWGLSEGDLKSKQFASEYSKIAQEIGWDFIDLSPLVHTSEIDGTHLDVNSNRIIAQESYNHIILLGL